MPWDPAQYLKFGDHRLRPAIDLLNRIDLDAPGAVYDLGCGAGNVTRQLVARWPDAHVVGVDSSEAMLAKARATLPNVDWRPAVIEYELPVPLTGTAAAAAVQAWTANRNCTGLQAEPGPPLATTQTETANPPPSELAPLRGVSAPG